MNKDLFISGYLTRISQKYSIDEDKAFEVFSIASILDMPFDEVNDNVRIKQGDGGIDGAVTLQQGDIYTLFLFQCKNSPKLKQNEIEKFKRDAEDIFNKGVNKLNSQGLNKIIDEYKQLTADGNIIDIRLYFIYSGINLDVNNKANEDLYKHFHRSDELEIWDSDALYKKIEKLIKSQNNRNKIQFTFNPESSNIISADSGQQAVYTYLIGDIKAANFRVKATELCELIDKETEVNGHHDFLFSENIRGFLGFGKKPNKRMRETLEDTNEAYLFPILNNGITIICERLEIPTSLQHGRYILPATNPVIVNGQQTTKTLYQVYKKDKERLLNVFVNVRAYETQNKSLIDRITDATNTQTAINFRDKVSNKAFNTYTKEIFENNNIAYITKKGETFSNKISKRLGESVESEAVLKYWYATFYEKPEVAKVSISKVLEEVFDATTGDNRRLNKLFNGDLNSPLYHQLFYAYKIYRCVQDKKSENEKNEEFVSHANELLSYGIYRRLENNLKETLIEKNLTKAYEYSLNIVREIVNDESIRLRQDGKEFSYNNFFKKQKCRTDYNKKANIEEKDNIDEHLQQILPFS